MRIFATVSVFIACLGLFGLSSYSAEQRSKEISIRKVLGAGVLQLIVMLCSKYALLLVLAFLIAAPASYYLMQQWLDNFVFRVEINMMSFMLAGMAAFIIAILTVSYQSVRAALVNPAKRLRSE